MGRMRPHVKEFYKLKKIQALMNNPTLKAAYRELHPNCGVGTADCASSVTFTPEIFEELKKFVNLEASVVANKEILEKVLFMVVARWMKKEEKTSDMIAAVKELTKLVPEFKDRLQVEDISKADEQELDRKLREFGYDPNRLAKPFSVN